MEEFTQTANINEKWLNNIYDNIQKLEEYERFSREGCENLFDYLRIPYSKRSIISGITQLKNLKFFITEFHLLLADLSPVINEDKLKNFQSVLNNIQTALPNERLFINEIRDLNRNIIETKPTDFFHQTLECLHILKIDLFREIKHILYIQSSNNL